MVCRAAGLERAGGMACFMPQRCQRNGDAALCKYRAGRRSDDLYPCLFAVPCGDPAKRTAGGGVPSVTAGRTVGN